MTREIEEVIIILRIGSVDPMRIIDRCVRVRRCHNGTLFFGTQLTNYMDVSRYMDEKFSGGQ